MECYSNSSYEVAPHAGAWIETLYTPLLTIKDKSHLMQVRGLKHSKQQCARISTLSHLMQVRGLKPILICSLYVSVIVAPHAGAWIETLLVGLL